MSAPSSTEVVFVPMLFLTPAAAVPLLVTLGAVLGELPDLLRKRAHPERLAVVVADGWYAIPPAIVVALLGEPTLAVLAVALLAQFAGDLVASSAREYFGARITPAELAAGARARVPDRRDPGPGRLPGGDQAPVPSTTPTGSSAPFSASTETASVPVPRAKKRRVGCTSVMQTASVTALAPAGMLSGWSMQA